MTVTAEKPTYRGTTNRNHRGNSKTRRQRREWLVATYRADVDLCPDCLMHAVPFGAGAAACRCYRCATLLTVDTVSADRIKPGAEGGRYRTPLQDKREGVTNLRPACMDCQSETGGRLGNERKRLQ